MTEQKVLVEIDLGDQEFTDKQAGKMLKRLSRAIGDTLLGASHDGLLKGGVQSVTIGLGGSEGLDRENFETLRERFEGAEQPRAGGGNSWSATVLDTREGGE